MNLYHPSPVDTSHVRVPVDLQKLMEKLARNAHEVWAAQRMSEGWTYGPTRDDAHKRRPCLKPYEELPESEKEYDRKTAGETIKMILSLGYSIQKRP